MGGRPVLPRWRWRVLALGTLLALSVYYLNYGAAFEEGEIQDGSHLTLVMRAGAVAAIVVSLTPFRLNHNSVLLCVLMYVLSAVGLVLSSALFGGLNDTLFVNTLLQLPVLVAVVGTRWEIDYARWLRFLCVVLTLQTVGDTVVWQAGASLWLSRAFVGGVGNPSSFGLLCVVGLAFCMFHPRAGPWRWPTGAVLAFGAVMSKALLVVLAVALVVGVWMMLGWRRLLAGLAIVAVVAFAAPTKLIGMGEGEETGFIEHKLKAVSALLGLVEYDVESSTSVSLRLEMHEETLAAIASAPQGLLWGHLEGLPYWPMDSQLLTYLGSFGAPMLALFLALHLGWTALAWRQRRRDGGFALLGLIIFGFIFTTNRVLDYFPVATLYFLLVAAVLRPTALVSERRT